MPFSTTAILAVIFAACFEAGSSALAARSIRLRGPRTAMAVWGSISVGLAYFLGHLGVATPSIPPADVTDRVPILAIAGAVVAGLIAWTRGGVWVRVVGFLALAVLGYFLMLGPVLGSGDLARETINWLAITAIMVVLAAINVAVLDAPDRRSEVQTALVVFALGVGVVLVLANSLVLFLLGGLLAVVLAAGLLGSWGMPLGGGIPVAFAVLSALIVEGFVYAFLPASSALVLAASPLALWSTRLGPIARLGPKTRCSIASVLILIPVAVAVALVIGSKSDEGY